MAENPENSGLRLDKNISFESGSNEIATTSKSIW